jgi:drug/metabolite transporter superfamily protein YnfA
MFLPTLIFALFALCSGIGAYLLLSHFRSRKAGVVGAVLTLLFFAALFAGLVALFRQGGLA